MTLNLQNIIMESAANQNDATSIIHLPDELISMILRNNDCLDIVRFSSTCKHYNEVIKSDQCLWKFKLKSMLPVDIFRILEKHRNKDWLQETKQFYLTKQKIFSALLSMSPQFYWKGGDDVYYEDMKNFYTIALSNNMTYYYTICILQDVIKKCRRNLDANKCDKPFTMTEMYYARAAVRYLLHTYQAVQWVQAHIREELRPDIVVNFFLQWIDTDHLHLHEDVEGKMIEMTKKVETILESKHSSKPGPSSIREKLSKGLISENSILAAITQVLYHQRHMVVTTAVNVDTLNIVKVLDNKVGNHVTLASIYQEVARRFGVKCDLIAFPNHLFLEYKDNSDPRVPQAYTINLCNGELQAKGRCPFSQHNQNTSFKYFPDSLLQYIYSAFHKTMGAIKNWHTRNALHLIDFLSTYDNDYNPYRHFLQYLLDLTRLPAMNCPLNLKFLSDVHLQLLSALANLNNRIQIDDRPLEVKRRDGRVKYAVGMICYHRRQDYICIIRGWDLSCALGLQRSSETHGLDFGIQQPFYYVIAADQSERYVAQENLAEVISPARLYHLEEGVIAREFTHFDGFSYVPNDEKKIEYPNEAPICSLFRDRSALMINASSNV